MNITLLGSGNVATHLGKALKLAGHHIIQVWSRDFEHARTLAGLLEATAVSGSSDISPSADIYIISVSDDAVADVAASIPFHNKLIIHTSGSVESNVLATASPRYGVLYPLQTFSKHHAVDFTKIPVVLEGSSPEVEGVLKGIASQISSEVYFLTSEQRRILHLAAVLACNFTNHLYALAEVLLSKNNLDFDMIRPLIAETAGKIQNNSPKSVQTGPAIRRDDKVIAKHLELIKDDPELYKLYQLLSQSIVNLN